MRIIFAVLLTVFIFSGCKKDKFTTVPQLKFKSVSPDTWKRGTLITSPDIPVLILHVTDAEGDLGFVSGKDTSFVYIKNLRTNKSDSMRLPDITKSTSKNFQGDIEINMFNFVDVPNQSKKDTIYFDVYIKDFAKNQSNTVRTDKPIYWIP